MAKLYTKKKIVQQNQLPKKETISFILNYSKAFRVTSFGKIKFECVMN